MDAGALMGTAQLVAWLLALIDLSLALYVLLLDARHPANRHVGALLALFAIIQVAVGLMSKAENAAQATLPASLLAATVLSVPSLTLVTSVAVVKPSWLRARWRWLWWLVYGLAILPVALTLADLRPGTQLWYTGLDDRIYQGGLLPLSHYTQGRMASPIRWGLYGVWGPTALVLLYVALRDEQASLSERRLAWLLLAAGGVDLVMFLGFGETVGPLPTLLVASAVSALAFAYAALEPAVVGRRPPRGRLQFRLTALMLAVALLVLLGVAGLLYVRSGAYVDQAIAQQMQAASLALSSNVSSWLDDSADLLESIVSSAGVVDMDAERQALLLKAAVEGTPYVQLAATVGLDGRSIARSDGPPGDENYGDRRWFQQVKDGSPRVLQAVEDETGGQPMLVQAMPIRDSSGRLVGVGMMASSLADIARQVQVLQGADGSRSYVVDASGQAIAHPDPLTLTESWSLAARPPVAALRQGRKGSMEFTDERGQAWRAYVDTLNNGWGVVVQWRAGQPTSAVRSLWQALYIAVGAGAVLLGGLTFVTIRQAFGPIGRLTETATAIARGDLARTARVEGGDEFAALARAFNSMTAQLRESISGLERIVAYRTQQLERHSSYLEATSQVAGAVASILEPERLMREVVDLICEQFDLYYVGLFLIDESGGWAVLHAGTGDSGRIMLERGHRIAIGEGMVGWCIANAQPRIAQDAELDGLRLTTPELPATRSEVALPLRARGRVLGALTVHSHRPGVFDEDTVSLLQTMADQVAIALENARLFVESQEALSAARRAYGQLSYQAWDEVLHRRDVWGYRYTRGAVEPLGSQGAEGVVESAEGAGLAAQSDRSGAKLELRLIVRDQQMGVLWFAKDQGDGEWTREETELLETLNYQLGAALEDALFFQTAQSQAVQEELVAEFSTQVRQTLDVESVIRAAVEGVRQALDLPEVVIRLAPEPGAGIENEAESGA